MPHILLITFLLACLSSNAQRIDKAALEMALMEEFGLYSDSLAPGIAVCVMQDGEEVFRYAKGRANLEHGVAFTRDTPVRMVYSGTREFMCAALGIMVSENLLSLRDGVRKYFPQLPAWSEEITILDLLNHSSGFVDEWGTMLLMQASMHNRVDKEQLLTLLYNQPAPEVEPGEGYMYCNSDMALLRFIMEDVAKMSLPDYLDKKLFKPLGMSSTLMNDDLGQIIPGLADNYLDGSAYFKRHGVKTSPGGNYRIVTTASDLEKWAKALEDSSSFVSIAFKRLYQNARPIPTISPQVHYVFGHEWEKVGSTDVIKHGGVNGDFYMARIPSQKVTVIVMTNGPGDFLPVMDVVRMILKSDEVATTSAVKPEQQPENSAPQIADCSGRYFEISAPGYSSTIPKIVFYEIRKEGDSLRFFFSPEESFILAPEGRNKFIDPNFGDVFTFSQSNPDSATTLNLRLADGFELNFVRMNPPADLSRDKLMEYAGEYFSGHLDFYCRVVLAENDELVLRRPTISDKKLIPFGEDSFLFEMQADEDGWYVTARFTRDKQGKIDGINMQHLRMMHHRFVKVK